MHIPKPLQELIHKLQKTAQAVNSTSIAY